MSRPSPIRELTRARLLVLRREPESVFWSFGLPLLLLIGLGIAFPGPGAAPSRIGIVTGRSGESVGSRLEQPDLFQLVYLEQMDESAQLLRDGRVDAVVEEGPVPEVHFDPDRLESALARYRVARALEPPDAVHSRGPREIAAPSQRSRLSHFMLPGLIGFNLMSTSFVIVGLAAVDLRGKRLLKRLVASPMRRGHLLASLVLARLAFAFVEVPVLMAFGVLLLGVPFAGSVFAFAIACLAGALSFSGISILAASRMRSTEGASGLFNLLMMPMWLAGGVFFPYERFPEVLHPALRSLPLPALNDGLRAIALDGVGLADVAPQLGIALAWGVACFAAALKVFRWE